MASDKLNRVREAIKKHPDFPKPGIVFSDIFPILRNPALFRDLNDLILEEVKQTCPNIGCVVGLESRGFLFGPVLALSLSVPFVPVRKKGKLPGELVSISYDLEYGSDTFEVQKDSIVKGQKVLIIDDLLATGGTMQASCSLMDKIGADVQLCLVIIELAFLQGRGKINKPLKSLISYSE